MSASGRSASATARVGNNRPARADDEVKLARVTSADEMLTFWLTWLVGHDPVAVIGAQLCRRGRWTETSYRTLPTETVRTGAMVVPGRSPVILIGPPSSYGYWLGDHDEQSSRFPRGGGAHRMMPRQLLGGYRRDRCLWIEYRASGTAGPASLGVRARLNDRAARLQAMRSSIASGWGPGGGHERVYVQRGPSGVQRGPSNEATLIEALEADGWMVIDPESMPTEEVARSLFDARASWQEWRAASSPTPSWRSDLAPGWSL